MRFEISTTSKIFTVFDAPALDPITVVLQDISPKHGRLIVECYGQAWSAYWGGMGDCNVSEFVIGCGADYITNKLAPAKISKRDMAYLQRIVEAVQQTLHLQEAR